MYKNYHMILICSLANVESKPPPNISHTVSIPILRCGNPYMLLRRHSPLNPSLQIAEPTSAFLTMRIYRLQFLMYKNYHMILICSRAKVESKPLPNISHTVSIPILNPYMQLGLYSQKTLSLKSFLTNS